MHLDVGLECDMGIGMVVVGYHEVFLFLLGQVLLTMCFVELDLSGFVYADFGKRVCVVVADFLTMMFLIVILGRLLARVHNQEILVVGVKHL